MGFIKNIRDSLSLRGNIPPLLLSALIECTGWNMFETVWQPYVLILGGSTTIIGALNSLWATINALLQFATGSLIDSIGRKKILTIYYALSFMGIAFSLTASSWIHLIPPLIIWGIADALGDPAFPPIFAESVERKNIGLALSLLSLTWWLPGLYSQLLGGYIGDNFGIKNVITVTLVLELISIIIFFTFVKETLKETKPFKLESVKKNIRGLLKPIDSLKTFYTISILNKLIWNTIATIFVAIIFKTYGFSLLEIGAILTAMSATTALLVIPMGKLVDKYGSVLMIRISIILAALTYTIFIYANNFTSLIIAQILRGTHIALWDPSNTTYMTNSVNQEERGRHFGNLNGLKGLASIPAPIIGAIIFESFGIKGVFSIGIIGYIILALLSIKLNENHRI